MLKISRFTVNDLEEACVTDDKNPYFSFAISSNRQGVKLTKSKLTMKDWLHESTEQIGIRYDGPPLQPFSTYTVTLEVEDELGNTASRELDFETGKLASAFKAQWITNDEYHFKERKVSPKPMYFKYEFSNKKNITKARIYATALGVYELELNGEKVGKDYFAPGFTSYKNQLQYQTYDITSQVKKNNQLLVTIAGGWAVGAFTYARRNRVYAKRQALLCELHLYYEDGTKEIKASNPSWDTSMEGPLKEAEFYNGEVYDATFDFSKRCWRKAAIEKLKINPKILAQYGLPVRKAEEFIPRSITKSPTGTWIYDLGQNFAGILSLKINGKENQKITIKHSEILMEGELFTEPLRTAKQELVYTCKEGVQNYTPNMTYMGFRYVGVVGIEPENIEIKGVALYSSIKETGSFSCSNELLNQLQSNIIWSAKSNFVDIPTDCPQRDERMGWTGDIALFARTASTNFNMRRFYDKWLLDVAAEQNPGGGIPVTVPLVVVPFQWEIMIPMAVDHWGDAVILVPWAEYLAKGDIKILQGLYPSMKKYVKACTFWAELFSIGKKRRIWRWLHHYGDWVAPEGKLWTWMLRGKWTGTASLANTSQILAEIAELLGEEEDARMYRQLHKETALAYRSVLMDSECRVKKEFQTAYVLPLYYQMLSQEDAQKTAANLVQLVRQNNYQIGTGFPGTPYILFALADHGYVEDAYKMLLTDTCPSWLFQVKAGGTTIWERWDALKEDGTSNTGSDDGTNGMVSFNHYANGAVGDFFYRRIAGIEPLEGGYRVFKVEPKLGGELTFAKAELECSYGIIRSEWQLTEHQFQIEVTVPIGTVCHLILPRGEKHRLINGHYKFREVREGYVNES